jgi:alanine racemase
MPPLRQLCVFVSSLAENVATEAASGPVVVDVSANAFGLGVERVAAVARDAGASGLFAVTADDALAARRAAPDMTVVVGRVHPLRGAELAAAGVRVAGESPGRAVRDGVYGFDGRSRATASLRTEVLSLKRIRAGDGVSYGYTYRAPRDEYTALVALGYGDGIHRHAGNVAHVLVDGRRVPVVGRVAMNVFVVSLGDDAVAPGAPVAVFGEPAAGDPPLGEWSAALDVAPAAVLAGLGDRVERATA